MKRGFPRAGFVSDSLTKIFLGTLVMSNANGVSWSLSTRSGGLPPVLQASVNPSTVSNVFFPPDGGATSHQQVNSIVSFQRIQVQAPVTFTRVDVPMWITNATSAGAETGNIVFTSGAVLYSRTGSTLSPIVGQTASTTYTWASNSANFSNIVGGRPASFALATYLAPGEYFLGVFLSTTNNSSIGTATTQLANSISIQLGSTYTASGYAEFGKTQSGTNFYVPFRGLVSITQSATSMTYQLSQFTCSGIAGVSANFPVFLRNI